MIRSLTLSRSKWSSSRTLARLVEVEVVLGHLVPRQRQDPVEVGADDAVLGRGRRQLLEPRELALGRLADVLGQLQLLEPLAELVHLGLLVVPLAELLLDRLQLLAEEVLALALLHLRLDLGLDLRAELDHLELTAEDARDCVQPLLDVGGGEQGLLLVGLQAHRRGDEVRERTRVVDVRGRDLELLREVRDGRDDPPEQVLDVARQRLELLGLLDLVRHLRELADQVRVVVGPPLELDPPQPLDQDPQRSVGYADQLVDDRGGADVVEIVPAGRLGLLVLDRDQRQHPVAGDDVVDQLDRALLPDRERRHRLREDDRVLQRQDRQGRRDLDVLLVDGDVGGEIAQVALLRPSTIVTLPAGGFGASGSTTVSRPRS